MRLINTLLILMLSFDGFAGQSTQIKKSGVKEPKQSAQPVYSQIGNSYFQHAPSKKTEPQKTISQIGSTVEALEDRMDGYLFFNQLFVNHIYYEFRAYALYHYTTKNVPKSPAVNYVVTTANENNPMGHGEVGILGYNVDVNEKISLMPFVRLQHFTNAAAPYEDDFGNEIHSVSYSALLGTKLSMRVTGDFAIYTQYYAGYQRSLLSGQGVYASASQPVINTGVSVIELGAPYKLTPSLSITPYLQFITTFDNPNQVALNSPYNISQFTNTNTLYAIKLGYNF